MINGGIEMGKNSIIDTFIYIAGSAVAFNVVLPLFAVIIKLAEIFGMI